MRKRTLIASLFTVALLGIPAGGAYCAEAKPGFHKFKTIDNEKIPLWNEKGCNVEILVPEKSPDTVSFAAKELKDVLDKSGRINISIVSKESGSRQTVIVLGREAAEKAGIDIASLPRDGFVIKTLRKNGKNYIFIAGSDSSEIRDVEKRLQTRSIWSNVFERATIFGVYDFLERFAGVRFYFPGEEGTIIPENKTLSVPAMDIEEAPDFYTYRQVSWFADGKLGGNLSKEQEQRLKNLQMYRLRHTTQRIPICHGLVLMGLIERFSKEHPEYFSLQGNGRRDIDPSDKFPGHLCYTNKGLEEEIYKDVEAYFTGRPAAERGILSPYSKGKPQWDPSLCQPGYFNIMPQDSLSPSKLCHCGECQKYVSQKKFSELVLGFVYNIAERLSKNNVPGTITTMAYSPYNAVTERPVPANVNITLAVGGPWSEFDSDMAENQAKFLKEWDEKLAPRKVSLWNYCLNTKIFGSVITAIPQMAPHAAGNYYKKVAGDIAGAYMESNSDIYIFNYLNYYMFLKVAWNTSTDVEKTLDEHHYLMFGPAAAPMEKFYGELEKAWTAINGKSINTPLGPRMKKLPEIIIYENIYSPEKINAMKKLFTEAEKLAASRPDCLKRIAYIKANFLDSIIEARKKYISLKREIEDLVFEIPQTPGEIKIDGKGDDEAWKKTEEKFLVPLDGTNASVKTATRTLWDSKNLYVFFDCKENQMSRIDCIDRKHDDKQIWMDNDIEIFLSSFTNKEDYYQLIINSSGNYADLKSGNDYSWESNAEIKTSVNPDGWTAEIKIPLEKLGIAELKAGSLIKANYCRSRMLLKGTKEENQLYILSPFLDKNKGFHQPDRFGTFHFVKEKSPDKSIIKNGSFGKFAPGRINDWNPIAEKKADKKNVTIDENIFVEGGNSVRISNPDGGTLRIGQWAPVKPNTKYRITFFIRTENIESDGTSPHTGACANIWAEKNFWFPPNWYIGTIPWTKQSFEFTTPENTITEKSYINLWLWNAKGTVWFDDVKIVSAE